AHAGSRSRSHRPPPTRPRADVPESAPGGPAGPGRRRSRRVLRAVQRGRRRCPLRPREHRRGPRRVRAGARRARRGVGESLVRRDEARLARGAGGRRGDGYVTIARAAAVAAGAVIASGCSLFGGGDSSAEPPAELTEIEQTLEITRMWSTRVGRGTEGLRLGLRPSTDGVNVYAGAYDGRVAAIDANTGREVWSTDTDAPLSAGPGYGNGVLVFGTSAGELLALEAESGVERWRVPVGSEVLAPPAVGSNIVVLRSTDGRLRGFSVANGREQWTVEQSQPPLTVRGDTKPEIAGQTVVAGFDNGRIGAYRIASGDPIWEVQIGFPAGRTELDRLVDIGGDLQIVGSDVY